MLQFILLALILLGEGVYMAPVLKEATSSEEKECKSMDDDSAIQDQLDLLIKEALLNDTDQMTLINEKFTLGPDEQKLCFRFSYNITCTDGEPCDTANATQNCSMRDTANVTRNCSDYSTTNIWLSFDPTTLAGRLLLHYAVINYEFLGLNWGGACDISPSATINLTITVPSLTLLCGVDGEKHINESLRRLTEQLPSIANISNCHGSSFAVTADNTKTQYVVIACAILLTMFGLMAVYPKIAGKMNSTDGNRHAYFQFWAFHVCITVVGVYVLHDINVCLCAADVKFIMAYVVLGMVLLVLMVLYLRFNVHELDTPAKCCNCKLIPSFFVLLSVFVLFFFTSILLYLIPTIIFIFYLYPIQTTIWLTVIANSVFYTNILIAALLFQCERAGYIVYKIVGQHYGYHTISDDFYDQYYEQLSEEPSKGKQFLICAGYLYQLLAKVVLLTAVVVIILMIYGLLGMDQNRFTDKSEVQMLFTIVTTVLLLFGSWYNLDIFLDIKKEKTQEELLQEIAQTEKLEKKVLLKILQEQKSEKLIFQGILRAIKDPSAHNEVTLDEANDEDVNLPDLLENAENNEPETEADRRKELQLPPVPTKHTSESDDDSSDDNERTQLLHPSQSRTYHSINS